MESASGKFIVVFCLALFFNGNGIAQQGGSNGKEQTISSLISQGLRHEPPKQIPPEPAKRELGAIDRWRFESCQQDASKAPTQLGVVNGLRVCREKFGQ